EADGHEAVGEDQHAAETPAAETDVAETAAPAETADAAGATSGGADWGTLAGDVELGRTKAKQICIACHVIEGTGNALPGAPPFAESANLARIDPEYLHKWLKDPAAVKPGTLMPNFGLTDAEIDNL